MKIKLNFAQGDRKRFWCLLELLFLLILTRYALQIDIPRLAFLLVIAVIVLLGDQDEIIAMCMCFIPLHESIDFFYALAIAVGVYVFRYHRRLHLGTNILLVVLVAVWELLHCFRETFSVVGFLTHIIPFLVLVVMMSSKTEKLDYPFIVRAFSWATLGVSLVMFLRVLYFSDFNFMTAITNLQRMGLDVQSNVEDAAITGGLVHPNSLGVVAVIAATGQMQLRSMRVSRRGDMILMCGILVLAALGTSRTYLACLIVMFFLLILAEQGGFIKKLRLIGVLCMVIAAAAVAMAVIFPDTFEYFVNRFSVADITTGRNELIVLYHRFLADNTDVLFFGIGLQDFADTLINHYRVTSTVPHNFLQEIVIAWGIPGLLLFAGLFFIMFRSAYRKNKHLRLINWIPLIILVFKSIAGQLLTSAYTMLALCYAYISLCTDFTPIDHWRPDSESGG